MAIEINERVNGLKANYLSDTLTLDDFMKTFKGTKVEGKKQYEYVKHYLQSRADQPETVSVYKYVNGRKDGRLYSGNSIQNCTTDIRGFLCDGISTDIDMKNAHPVILKQLCDNNNILCPYLSLYCNNRESCLEDVMRECNCERNEAKKNILISTNKNKKIKTNCEFLKNYDKEIKTIQKKFLEINDFGYIKDFAKKEYNFEGSFINHVLCIHENQILSAMRKFCEINKYEIQGLMFDGLMVYGNMDNDTLQLMQNYIHENTEFESIELSIKPHETTFTLPTDYKVKPKIYYEDLKREFEKNNCKVDNYFICEKHGRKIEYKRDGFAILHEELQFYNPKTKGENKWEPFIYEWYRDASKLKFDYAESYPKKTLCPKWCYNMWNPFPVESMDKQEDTERNEKALQMFLGHIDVLTNFNKIHSDFVLLWLRQMFQFPEYKSIELIFISKEGAGKGTFLTFLKTMMGGQRRVWECTDPLRDIFGDFNDSMVDAMLVCFNESSKANFYNSNGKKLGLITDETININMKGGRKFPMKSYHRFILFSNNVDPNNKNKRRDFSMRCSDSKINDVEYWKEINDYANDINCCKYIYDYLMKTEVQSRIGKTDIPEGEYDNLLIESQRHHIFDWLDHYVWLEKDDYLKIGENYLLHYPTYEVWDNYKDWCSTNHINSTYRLDKQPFAMKIFGENYKSITRKVKKFQGKTQNAFQITFPDVFNELGIDINQQDDD